MSVTEDLRRYAALMEDLFGGVDPPKQLKQIRPLVRLDSGENVDVWERRESLTPTD